MACAGGAIKKAKGSGPLVVKNILIPFFVENAVFILGRQRGQGMSAPQLEPLRDAADNNRNATTSDAVPSIPEGWTRVESRSVPGCFYYVTPTGHATWDLPSLRAALASRSSATLIQVTVASSHNPKKAEAPKPPQRCRINSTYRKDYLRWGLETQRFNPRDVDMSKSRPSKSYAAHPKAKPDPSYFISLNRQDYTWHKGVDHSPLRTQCGLRLFDATV